MSKVVRKSKTREKISAQYGVADLDPADLDVKPTKHENPLVRSPKSSGIWRGKVHSRQRSESPEFISTTPDAMSTDEAIEISKKIDEEIAQEGKDKDEIDVATIVGLEDTLPTVAQLQTPKPTGELYEEIKEELGSSGVISFPKIEKALKDKMEKDSTSQGIRAPLATAPDMDKMYEISSVPSIAYTGGPDFDSILKEGDEFIERTYSMMEATKTEEEPSQSFVVLKEEEKQVSSSIYENITQDLKDIMSKEVYLPTSQNQKVSDRQPKLWVKQTPFEGNPAVIVKIEEWLKEVGTQDFAVDVKEGVIYAIKGDRWERMPIEAQVSTEEIKRGTPVIGPIDQTIRTPTSQEPIPLAESTRKEVPIYDKEPQDFSQGSTIDPESVPRSKLEHTPVLQPVKKKLDFDQSSENDQQIQIEIDEAKKAEENLAKERQRIEEERQQLLKIQQQASKERLIALRQQRKRLEESIAQMSMDMAHNMQITYTDRLSRRQNLINEYNNQIEREEQVVEDFIDNTDEQKDITVETMTTDSTLSSTADPIDFMDESTMMKIRIKQIRAEQCKARSIVMYKHFIKKAKELKKTKEQKELEDLMMASMKSLDRKMAKYKRTLDSYEEREKLYFRTLEQKENEVAQKQEEEKLRKEKEEAELKRKQIEASTELGKMKEQEKLARKRKEEMEAKIKIEREKQLRKLEQIAEEKEKLKRLQRQRDEQALTEAFLLKEQKHREEIEEQLTKNYLEKEKLKEEQKQKELTEQFLEKERQEKERMKKSKMKIKTPNLGKEEFKKRPSKPTYSEQRVERQNLFDTLNEVVVNGQRPTPKKDLRWDYGQDKKAKAIFDKMKKYTKPSEDKHIEEIGDACPLCGQLNHKEENCPLYYYSTKERQETSEPIQEEVCSCCQSIGHKVQECPWNEEESLVQTEEVKSETPYQSFCIHCRALDHTVEDCPSLKDADIRRRKVTCERCGKQGHDVTACLDETETEKEKEMNEKIKRKEEELERINIQIRKIKSNSKGTSKPQDKDTNTTTSTRGRTTSRPGDYRQTPKYRKQSPGGPRQSQDTGPIESTGGGPDRDPPEDPDGSDNGDDGEDDDDDDDDDDNDDDEDDDEESETSEESELSNFLYDMKGNKVNIEELFLEWQNNKGSKPETRIIRGPRGHRGPRGKQGRKGLRGARAPAVNQVSPGNTSGNISLNTSGLEDSFKELGNSMRNVWTVQKNLNSSMRDHIQITAQVQRKNTEALEKLNESTRQRDHDHMFMSINVYDGADPKKFEPWIEQIEIACRISGRDPRVVALAKSTSAVIEVIRSMRAGLSWVEFKNELKRCFSESKSMMHAALILENFRKQDVNENLRSYIHKYTKLHREATDRSCEDEYDTKAKLHFLSRLRNGNIAAKISQSAEFEKYKNYSLQRCMEKALVLESRLQVREMVTQAREAVDTTKTPEIMEQEVNVVEEELNNLPDDKAMNKSKASSICYKCGDYGHYGRECPAASKDLEEIASRIVGRIEHTFQAYTPVTLQYMNDVISKAAKLDQSRRVAKTKVKLLQGMLDQKGTSNNQAVSKPVGKGRGTPKPAVTPASPPSKPPVSRGRGRGAANVVVKKTKTPNKAPRVQTNSPPTTSPITGLPKTQDPKKKDDTHLPQISEMQDEVEEEDLEDMTLKDLDALQQELDQDLTESDEDLSEEEEQ